ncbi:dephospho-CoA kinase [Motiliproteus sp. SC1-56]|uniref:dephospho-CoA kinase n=1 Tax=Motiliproteus sp. SC1-56 TaxID=2799565 RepID=UPI001A90C4C5|nr:dephospho-CoA kinase [Motiliproteus sp. SC1-56]
MFVVGLTGGIGSGKSTVAQCFARRGIAMVDADIVAREVVMPGEPALQNIFDHFGLHLRRADGSLDRAALREAVFSDENARHWLEQLLHPLIRERTLIQLQSAPSPYVMLVSPLLLETDQHELADHILVVDVEEATQIARTMTRDHNSEAQVRAILDAQLGRQARLSHADSVIDNEGNPAQLEAAVEKLHRAFLDLAQSKTTGA